MKLEPLDPVGARVTGVALDDVPPGDVDALRGLLAEHGVLIFAGQTLDDAAFVALLRSFGELAFTKGETHVDGHADLNVVSNVGRTTPPKSAFHVDTSYVREPPAYTALRAVRIPERGGATQFTNQYRAYETLPDDIREPGSTAARSRTSSPGSTSARTTRPPQTTPSSGPTRAPAASRCTSRPPSAAPPSAT